jgi:hypothetical protein
MSYIIVFNILLYSPHYKISVITLAGCTWHKDFKGGGTSQFMHLPLAKPGQWNIQRNNQVLPTAVDIYDAIDLHCLKKKTVFTVFIPKSATQIPYVSLDWII